MTALSSSQPSDLATFPVAAPPPLAAMLSGLELRARRITLTRARQVVVCLEQLLGTLRSTSAHEVLMADRSETTEALHRLAMAMSPIEYWRSLPHQQTRPLNEALFSGVPETAVGVVEEMLHGWKTWVQEHDTLAAGG